LLSVFAREFFPIYPANKKVQSWDIYACVRQALDVLDPIDEPLPKSVLQQRNLITEDEALRAIHLAENTAERERAQARLTFDEAVGLQWALVRRRYGELSESGPVARPESDGLLTAMREQLPFELTDGQKEVLDILSADPIWADWSGQALTEFGSEGPLIINPVIYAEVSQRYTRKELLDHELPGDTFIREDVPWSAAFLAGKAYFAYRQRGGQRRSPLPDFFIGSHAAVAGLGLLTRDAARYRTYFPSLHLIAPN